jgi:hypothetical protein
MKMMLLNEPYPYESVMIHPMYDTFNEIIGTMLLLFDDTFEILNQNQSFS